VRDEIYWVVTASVHPGKFEKFKDVVAGLVAETHKESGSLAYDYSVNEQETVIQVFESYADSDAVVHHVTKTFPEFAERFTECVTIEGFAVYGAPNPAAREILDGFGSTYMSPFEGFTRKH
jgi:quinol monooxygenase YgiN